MRGRIAQYLAVGVVLCCVVSTVNAYGVGLSGVTAPPVIIDFFFESGCSDCARVRGRILPELQDRFEGFYVLRSYDLSVLTNVVRLVAYQEALTIQDNRPVCMVVDYGCVLNGFAAIETGLIAAVDEAVAARAVEGWRPPVPIPVPETDDGQRQLASRRLSGFTLAMVIMNGLLDGINPCAIGTLIFFMSLLAVSKVRGAALAVVGGCFCLASFVTYTAIGFGLFQFIHTLSAFRCVRIGIEVVIMFALSLLAFLSFRDTVRYRRTGNPANVTLQLSDAMKQRIRRIMRSGLGIGSLVLGGLLIGAVVTVIESVCTGQVYLPTIVLVIRTTGAARPCLYLLLYNAMFILPMVVVFILALRGTGVEAMVQWSRRHFVASKIALGLLFLVMAVLVALF